MKTFKKETIATKNLSTSIPKRKNKLSWLLPIFFLLTINFLFLTFGTALSPELAQKEHGNFVTSLGKTTKDIVSVPSGRVVSYLNAWDYPTVRIVIVHDYRFDLKDGRCVFFHYPFDNNQNKECFGMIAERNIEDANNFFQEGQ